jgi:hypothetical protein
MKRAEYLLALAVLMMVVGGCSAHAPILESGSNNISSALQIEDHNKSIVYYSELKQDAPQYFRIAAKEGDRIHLGIIASPVDRSFVPELAVARPLRTGSVLNGSSTIMAGLPQGYVVAALPVVWPEQATYEPFAPSTFYDFGDLDEVASKDGDYIIMVHSSGDGFYGLISGYEESFGLQEWIMLPIRLITVYRWEGQSLLQIFAPMVVILILGIVAIRIWRIKSGGRWHPARGMTAFSGLLFVGTSASALNQMAFSVNRSEAGSELFITLGLAAIPLVLGLATIALSVRRNDAYSNNEKLSIRLLGLMGLMAGSGLIAGPMLAILSTSVKVSFKDTAKDSQMSKGAKKVKGRRD